MVIYILKGVFISNEPKTERFEMRLSWAEKDDLEKYATACDMTITDYVKALIWCQKPAKLPINKYELILEQLLSLNRNLKELSKQNTASKIDIDKVLHKTELLTDEVLTAIKKPFAVIDPYNTKKSRTRTFMEDTKWQTTMNFSKNANDTLQ